MFAMILAAGMGTRLMPLTDNTPKALLEVAGKPLLLHTIEKLISEGCDNIIVNVHHHASQIIDFVKANRYNNVNIAVSDESDMLLDTGGGLKKAGWFFDTDAPFILHVCDILSDINLRDMLMYHKKSCALVTLAVQTRKTTRPLLFDMYDNLCGWRNDSTGDVRIARETEVNYPIAFSGIHVIDPRIFRLITEEDKFPIFNMYLRLARNYVFKAYNHDESHWFEFGKVENFTEGQKYNNLKDLFKNMKQ